MLLGFKGSFKEPHKGSFKGIYMGSIKGKGIYKGSIKGFVPFGLGVCGFGIWDLEIAYGSFQKLGGTLFWGSL